MKISEININTHTHKENTSRYDFDEYIGRTEPTGKKIGGYEVHVESSIKNTPTSFLIKAPDDEGYLGLLMLQPFSGMYQSEVFFAPELQGKKLAVPLYMYVIKELGYTLVSDSSQSEGGAYIWQQLAESPDVNVYIWSAHDRKFHGEYDPRDSGRVYGPEDWRHDIRLVATTKTVTNEAWSEKYKKSINCSNPKGFSQKAHCAGRKKKTNESVDIPEPDDSFFKDNRFKRTEYAGMKLVYGKAYQLFQIYAYSMRDQAMGAVMFRYDPEYDAYIADDVYVEDRFRRQGVATAMYDFAKEQLDAPIKPSTAQTDKGAAFWGKKEVWEAELEEGDVVPFNRQQRMYRKGRALLYAMSRLGTYTKRGNDDKSITYSWLDSTLSDLLFDRFGDSVTVDDFVFFAKTNPKIDYEREGNTHNITFDRNADMTDIFVTENFADGKKKGKSRPGRVKKAGASCKGSVSHLRKMAKKYSGERGKMYHWCANMKGGKKKK